MKAEEEMKEEEEDEEQAPTDTWMGSLSDFLFTALINLEGLEAKAIIFSHDGFRPTRIPKCINWVLPARQKRPDKLPWHALPDTDVPT